MSSYSPRRGDVVWLNFDPQKGHEQRGRRPALVLSPEPYNRRAQLAIVCPISSHAKRYPFEVLIPDGLKITGVILSDHAKSLDWKARDASFCCHLPSRVVLETLGKLDTLLST